MKANLLTVFLLTSFYQSFSQNNSSLPIAIHLRIDSIYEKIHDKEYYEKYVRDNNYTINTDSVTQKYYDISVEISNTAEKPVSIWMMNCSWEDNIIVNNNYMFDEGHVCNNNFPTLVTIKPGEIKTYTTTLMKSIRFDYTCTNCILGPQVEATKLGLIVIDDVFKPTLNMMSYFLVMEDKSRWQIVWSDSLYLLTKQADAKIKN